MAHVLPVSYRGATHVAEYNETLLMRDGQGAVTGILVRHRYGTLDAEGAFVPDPDMGHIDRMIAGPEFTAFLQAHGTATINQLPNRLRQWCDTYGWCVSTWSA